MGEIGALPLSRWGFSPTPRSTDETGGIGNWGIGNGEWGMGNGEMEIGNGEWK